MRECGCEKRCSIQKGCDVRVVDVFVEQFDIGKLVFVGVEFMKTGRLKRRLFYFFDILQGLGRTVDDQCLDALETNFESCQIKSRFLHFISKSGNCSLWGNPQSFWMVVVTFSDLHLCYLW